MPLSKQGRMSWFDWRGCGLRRIILSVMVLILSATGVGRASDVKTAFEEGNAFYEQRDFESAIRVYESIVHGGAESATLYYNLGNAYFKSGDIGHAVLNYLRAQRLNPSDEDIVHNLEFARRLTRVDMEGVQLNPITSFIESVVDSYRLKLLAWLSSVLFVLFMLALVVRYGIGLRLTALRIGTMVLAVLLVGSAGLTTFKYRIDYLTSRVVIIAEEAPVRNGPTENADIEFQGAPGLVAEIVRRSGDYYNVLFENKRRGWIKRDLVAEV